MVKKSLIYLATAFLLLLLAGCESNFDPLNEEKGTYSVYGYLDLSKDVNYIRIKDLNQSLVQDTTGKIDAEVTLEDLDHGTTEILQDTIVEFDGVQTHNYRVTTDLQFDTEYLLSIDPSDGEGGITATATAPYNAEVNLEPEEKYCNTPLTLTFEPVRSEISLDLDIGFHYRGSLIWVRSDHRIEEDDQIITVEFTPINVVAEHFAPQRVFCEDLSSDNFYIRYTHYGPDLFDDTISATLNVPGGAGRFGVLYRNSFTFQVARQETD